MVLASRLVQLVAEELADIEPRRFVAERLDAFLPHLRCNYLRTSLWRAAGARIGARSRVMGPLHVTGLPNWRSLFEIGSDSFVSGPLRVDVGAALRIGNHVYLGHDVMLLTFDHEIGPSFQRCGSLRTAPITIGDGAWLASRTVVLPGVVIGAGAIVAAGAVVTRDVPADCLVGGNPARVIRELDVEPDSGLPLRLGATGVPLRLVSER